jgi:hypothetical protein
MMCPHAELVLGRARSVDLEQRRVEVETDEGVRTIAGARREDAPRIVADLVASGRRVYGVRVLTSTLEETYLEAVGGETS